MFKPLLRLNGILFNNNVPERRIDLKSLSFKILTNAEPNIMQFSTLIDRLYFELTIAN